MSEHAREVEGVLLVNADDQAAAGDRVAALEAVDRFQLRPRPAQRIRDVYIDTDDGARAGSRVAFRLREQDGRPLLTLKADAVRSGLASERLELEAPWSAEALQAALEGCGAAASSCPPRRRGAPGNPGGVPRWIGRGSGGGAAGRPGRPRPAPDPDPRDHPHPPGRGRAGRPGRRAGGRADPGRRRLPAPRREGAAARGRGRGQGPRREGDRGVGAGRPGRAEPDDLRPWPYGKLVTGRAVGELLADGRLEGLLEGDGRIRPAAHDLLAEFISK